MKGAKMATQNYYEGVNHVVYISTDESKGCDHCDFRVGFENFAESINHYIDAHGYKLLHVGQESSRDINGNPFHLTVAVVGK
jgi:hypothetical protein